MRGEPRPSGEGIDMNHEQTTVPGRPAKSTSQLGSAGTAGLQLAIFALEDVPVRPAMAHGADPLDEGGFRLQNIE